MTLQLCRKYLISTGKFKRAVVHNMKDSQVWAIWYRLTGQTSVPKYRR